MAELELRQSEKSQILHNFTIEPSFRHDSQEHMNELYPTKYVSTKVHISDEIKEENMAESVQF